MCGALGIEVHPLFECRHWRRARSDLTDVTREYQRIANTSVSAKSLWGRGTCVVSRGRDRRCEQQSVPHRWVSDASEEWRKDAVYKCHGQIAVDGSLRVAAGEHAACGWAVVQLDVDGGDTLGYRMLFIFREIGSWPVSCACVS